MKRMLSHIIILLLLVVAPVSFSTDKIPNFDKPATQSSHIKEARKVTVAVRERPAQLLLPVALRTHQTRHSTKPIVSASLHTPENNSGRDPPAITSA